MSVIEVVSKLIFNLKIILFSRRLYRNYKQCLKYIDKSTTEKMALSFAKRKSLVEYAYENCPFYREYYDSCGFNPNELVSESDWEKVPVLEKSMIRENCDNMISRKANRKLLRASKTGGSTGAPLTVYKSKNVRFDVLAWRTEGYYGIKPYMNEGIVHRNVPTTIVAKLKNRLMWWPTRRAYLNATSIRTENIQNFVDEIKSKKIKWVVGYCGALEQVADYVLNKQISIDSVKLVWSTSSPLTELVRAKLENAFGCEIMDQYGCCEMGAIAFQRPAEKCLCVNSDYVHVDIIGESNEIINATHQLGDVCISDLNTIEFPLIKYRLGDKSRYIKTMEESSDGFPRIDFVKGRISDTLIFPSGKVIDGSFLTTICDDYQSEISSYQIHQKADYSVEIKFVLKADNKSSEQVAYKIAESVKDMCDEGTKFNVNIVDKIDHFAGKRKFIISDIALSKVR